MDSARCRTLLNSAAQKISGLQREVWQLERQLNWALEDQSDRSNDGASSAATGHTSRGTPSYAVAPIGGIDRADDEPTFRSQPVFLNLYPVITNLGTMIDVLV